MYEKKVEEEFEDIELSSFQRDAFTELANMGACHAATSLSEMIGMPLHIEVPLIEVLPIKDAKKIIEIEKIVAGTFLQLNGDFSGYMHILFPERSAFALIDILMGKTIGETNSIASEMEESALKETGNILTSSLCNATADFLEITLMPSPPSFALDMAGAIVENAILILAQVSNYVIVFKSIFLEKQNDIYCYILLFPRHDKLKRILSLLEEKVKVTE